MRWSLFKSRNRFIIPIDCIPMARKVRIVKEFSKVKRKGIQLDVALSTIFGRMIRALEQNPPNWRLFEQEEKEFSILLQREEILEGITLKWSTRAGVGKLIKVERQEEEILQYLRRILAEVRGAEKRANIPRMIKLLRSATQVINNKMNLDQMEGRIV